MQLSPEFFTASVLGIPIIFIVVALVGAIKEFGLQGRYLTLTSLGLGLLFGIGYQVSVTPDSLASYSFWFGSIIYGLALGYTASKFYDVLSTTMFRQVEKFIKRTEDESIMGGSLK
jgi:hypothetical protein